MPSRPRIVVPHQPLHIHQRGNDRMPVFLDAGQFAHFLDLARVASTDSGCHVHAYVVMSNHFHFLLTPEDEQAPARLMQSLTRRYARTFNYMRGRTGTLWEGRYHSLPINSPRYFLACSRYIELNPVRAGMTRDPRQYTWSSHARNAHGRPDPFVSPHSVYRALGASAEEQQSAYRALCESCLDAADLDRIRRGTALGRHAAEDSAPTGFSWRHDV